MSKRILIVEDHADIRTLIHMTLEVPELRHPGSAECRPGPGDGRARPVAARRAAARCDDARELDGLDLCRLVKSDPALGHPQVAPLSARWAVARH